MFPGSGKPGLMLHVASSSRKRLGHYEDHNEVLLKRTRQMHEYPSPWPRPVPKPSPALPKSESSSLDLQHRETVLQQTLPKTPSPRSETRVDIKNEAGRVETRSAFTCAEDFVRSAGHIQNTRWAHDDYNETLVLPSSEKTNLEVFTAPPLTQCVSADNLFQIESSTQQIHLQNGLNTSDSLWPTNSNGSDRQEWPSDMTQLGGCSLAMTQIDQLACAAHVPSLTGSILPYIYSDQASTFSEQSTVTYSALTRFLDADPQHFQYDPLIYFPPQFPQKDGLPLIESVFPQLTNSTDIPHDLHASLSLDPNGLYYGPPVEHSTNLSVEQWPAQRILHPAITEDPDSSCLSQGLSTSPQWNHNSLSMATSPSYGLQEGHSLPGTTSISPGTYNEARVAGQPCAARFPFNRPTFDAQTAINCASTQPSSPGPLLPRYRPLKTGSKRSVHPKQDSDIIFECQSSRQGSKELAPGTLDATTKPRKPFGEDQRQETSRTRDVGACIRCKMQRVRVSAPPFFFSSSFFFKKKKARFPLLSRIPLNVVNH